MMQSCAISSLDEQDHAVAHRYQRNISYSSNFCSTEVKSILKANLDTLMAELDSCTCDTNGSACRVSKEMHQMLGGIFEVQQNFTCRPRSVSSCSFDSSHGTSNSRFPNFTHTAPSENGCTFRSSRVDSVDGESVFMIKNGYLLIINNIRFEGRLDTRNGTRAEGKKMEEMFKSFGFETDTVYNCKDLHKDLQQRISNLSLSKYDCFALLVLSHGSEDGVLLSDNNSLDHEEIMNMVKGENCPAMIGKPKILLFQACRGTNHDPGSKVYVRGGADVVRDGKRGADNQPILLVPTDSEILMVCATTFGRYANKYIEYKTGLDPVAHSWFLDALYDVFKQFAEKEDVLSMLARVNSHVALMGDERTGKQISCQFSTLTRKVFLSKIK